MTGLPTFVSTPEMVKTGPGFCLYAPLGSAVPTITTSQVSNSSFSGVTFDAAWLMMGYTDEGISIKFGKDTEAVEVAEELQEIRTITTKVNAEVGFNLASLNRDNLALALSGGTWTVTGAGTGQCAKFDPPKAGEEARFMFAWISAEKDEIFIAYQVFQGSEITWERKKGANKASLQGVGLKVEVPDTSVSTVPWNYYQAGTWGDAIDY